MMRIVGRISLSLLIFAFISNAIFGAGEAAGNGENSPGFVESFVETIDSAKKAVAPVPAAVVVGSDRDPGETESDRREGTDAATAEEGSLKSFTPEVIDEIPQQKPPTEAEESESAAESSIRERSSTLAMQMLKWKIREALAWHFEHPQKVTDRSPWGVMHAMLPYGVDSQIIDANGRRQNAVGFLCYNYAARGQRLFYLKDGKIAANIGPGLQGHRGQFLAMLAQSKIDPAYPMRIEGKPFKVSDLIEYEKFSCEAGTELTFKLIAFSHYLPHDATWKNFQGEEWDFSRLIREELKQPVVGAACGGTHRMTGFSHAAHLHVKREQPLEGQWLRASKYVDSYHDYAFTLQNRDGSFSTNWFASRGELPDPGRRLQTGGHILEWLVYSLPEERLAEPQVVKGVEYIAGLLNEGHNTKWEIGPLGHALHALALYDERMFGGKPGQRTLQLARENRIPPKTQKK